MSDDIINFYKKTSNDVSEINNVPAIEPIVEQLEVVRTTDPFEGFLQTLAENLEKTKASDFKAGPVEYDEAGIWTNESALQRAKELIDSNNIRFV